MDWLFHITPLYYTSLGLIKIPIFYLCTSKENPVMFQILMSLILPVTLMFRDYRVSSIVAIT